MTTIALPVLSNEPSLASYMERIKQFPYLEPDEEYVLAKRWADSGEIDAAHQLVTSHLRLVAKVAMSFRGYGLPVFELISEGNIGLMQAVKKFDPDKGFRLSTYAMWWIRASIQEYVLRSWSLVKIGTTAAQKKLFFNLKRMKSKINKIDNSTLSPDEVSTIARALNVSADEVSEMDSRLSYQDQSLDAPANSHEDDSASMIDYLESNDPDHGEAIASIHDYDYKRSLFISALDNLSEREKAIIQARRLNEPASTLEDLSQEYGVSRERVRQIEVRAVEKLTEAVSQKYITAA